jgi:hypothetical protein
MAEENDKGIGFSRQGKDSPGRLPARNHLLVIAIDDYVHVALFQVYQSSASDSSIRG